MKKKLKILILIKSFNKSLPKHEPKFDTIKAIEKFADVRYWHKNGEINDILNRMKFIPDFILHYDNAWSSSLSPMIKGLGTIKIPKGCIVIDIHYSPAKRRKYINNNKIDLIFSVTKSPFLKTFPQYKDKFRWFPFAINPEVFKDWNIEKDINFLLMGQVFDRERKSANKTQTPRGKYPFREEVLVKMRKEEGFLFHQHPGHHARQTSTAFLNVNYAKELNRTKMFFTCGSKYHYPVLKYFEAPACRSLLLAKPVPDLLELGFIDGENFIACNESNFHEKAMYYLENEAERTRITDNGYQFIHTHHTNDVRAQQFVKHVEEYLAEYSTP